MNNCYFRSKHAANDIKPVLLLSGVRTLLRGLLLTLWRWFLTFFSTTLPWNNWPSFYAPLKLNKL